jgi:lysozyme family protein
MPITMKEALVFTLAWEGGFTNHPLDPGGATNYGIIQSRYDEYRKFKGLARQSVKFITKSEYEEIYDKYYWDPVRAQYLSGPLGLALFDTAVNLGVGGCISRLQSSLKVPITGRWTKEISDVIHSSDQTAVAINICKLRVAKRYARVKQNSTQRVFLRGWLNRDNALLKKVKSMAGVSSLAFDEFSYEFDDEEIQNEFDPSLLDELEGYDETHGT